MVSDDLEHFRTPTVSTRNLSKSSARREERASARRCGPEYAKRPTSKSKEEPKSIKKGAKQFLVKTQMEERQNEREAVIADSF